MKKISDVNVLEYLKKISSLKESTSRLAFSIAFGLFIGLFIPIGFQTIVLLPLTMVLQVNVPLSLAATLISNPITAIPIYYSAFEIGKFVTRIELPFSNIMNLIENPSFESLLYLSKNGLTAFFVGCAVQATVVSIISYVTFKYVIQYYRSKNLIK